MGEIVAIQHIAKNTDFSQLIYRISYIRVHKKQLALDLDLEHVITCHVFLPTDLHAGPFPQRHCEGGVPPAVAHRHDAVLKRITRIIYVFLLASFIRNFYLVVGHGRHDPPVEPVGLPAVGAGADVALAVAEVLLYPRNAKKMTIFFLNRYLWEIALSVLSGG